MAANQSFKRNDPCIAWLDKVSGMGVIAKGAAFVLLDADADELR